MPPEERDNRSYYEFSDRPSGGWSYEGDGNEASEFFYANSNFDDIIRGMSYEERSAFSDYWAPGHFMYGQQWQGFDNMSREDQNLTRIYDRVLDQARLDEGITLHRLSTAELVLGAGRTRVSSIEELLALKGKQITAAGNMSFGAAKEGLYIGPSGSKQIEYKLRIPGGTKGAGMWIGDHRINGFGPDQREYMTNRDTSYRIGNTTYDRRRDVYVVELDYVGRRDHDYGRRGR